MDYINFVVTLIIVLLIFWMANGQKKKQDKQLKQMQENIKEKDKIVTYSGISGVVTQVLEDRVIIEVNPSKVCMSIEKWAIAGIDDRNKEQKIKKEEK